MDFDELVELLDSFVGKTIEASLQVTTFDETSSPVTMASIDLTRVGRVDRRGDVCRLWMTRDDPSEIESSRDDALTFRRDLYIAADFIADRHDDVEPVGETGMTWTLKVRQSGVQTEILIYV